MSWRGEERLFAIMDVRQPTASVRHRIQSKTNSGRSDDIDAESWSVIQWSNAIQKTALGQFVGRARLLTIRLEMTLWAGRGDRRAGSRRRVPRTNGRRCQCPEESRPQIRQPGLLNGRTRTRSATGGARRGSCTEGLRGAGPETRGACLFHRMATFASLAFLSGPSQLSCD